VYCKVLFKVKLTGVKPVATVVPACFNIIEKPVLILPTMSCVVTVNVDVVAAAACGIMLLFSDIPGIERITIRRTGRNPDVRLNLFI